MSATTFEVIDHLIMKLEDTLNQPNTVDTGIVNKTQLIRLDKIAKEISRKAKEAIDAFEN